MKKLFTVLVLAASLYIGASYILGGQVRERYFQTLEEREAGMVTLSNTSYERGLFTSWARTLVEFRVPAEPGETDGQGSPSRLVVRHVFHHGPFPAPRDGLKPMIALVDSAVEHVDDSGELGELFREFPELADTTSTVRVGLDGVVDGDLLVPAFERDGDRGRFVWGGLSASASQDPATGALRGEYFSSGLTGETAEGSLAVEGFRGRFDVIETLPMVFVGNVEGSLAALTVTEPGDDPVILTGLDFTSDSEMAGNLIHYRQRFDIGRVEAGGMVCGPVVCDMETRNLDASALSEFQAGVRELYAPGLDVEEVSRRAERLYARLFETLLSGSPRFTVHALRVPTSMGSMEANMDVRLDAPDDISAANILLLLRSVDAAAEISVDESLLVGLARLDLEAGGGAVSGDDAALDDLARRMVAGQLDPLLARNLVVRDGHVLKTSAVLREGRLQVNGQETPLF